MFDLNKKLSLKKGTSRNLRGIIDTSLKQKPELSYFEERSNNNIKYQDNINFFRVCFLTQILEKYGFVKKSDRQHYLDWSDIAKHPL